MFRKLPDARQLSSVSDLPRDVGLIPFLPGLLKVSRFLVGARDFLEPKPLTVVLGFFFPPVRVPFSGIPMVW